MSVVTKPTSPDYTASAMRRVNYLSNGKGSEAPKATQEYHPQLVMGACSRCKNVGTLEFPPGTFNWDTADNLMDRRKAVIFCPHCNDQTEFIPVPPDIDPGEETLAWLQKQERLNKDRRLRG